jgi:hypothetical protein
LVGILKLIGEAGKRDSQIKRTWISQERNLDSSFSLAVPERERWIREIDRCGGLYKIGFVQRHQKLKEGSVF